MYVSVTGLKTKGGLSTLRFWLLAVPAFNAAKKASGIIFCETKTRHGYHHTLTVWETKAQMLEYRKSPAHLKAMRNFTALATGKVYGYESNEVPDWEAALNKWHEHAGAV